METSAKDGTKQEQVEQLADILESFENAILITHHGEKSHARPMEIAKVEGVNTLWFVTSEPSPKTDEIARDTRVSVTLQSERRFVALSGRADLVKDRQKIDEIWKPAHKTWFPEGKEDPSLMLIRVDVQDVEYWDISGTKGIRYVFEAAKAIVKGETPEMVEGQHGRLKPFDGVPSSVH